jgi:hypothetical protein
MVAYTPQTVTVVPGTKLVGKPFPINCSPKPPLVPPELILRLVRDNGKLKEDTAGAGALGTIPTCATVTTGG